MSDVAGKVVRTSIPDLSFDGLGVDADGTSREFYSDGGFRFEVELVSRESRENCRAKFSGPSCSARRVNYDCCRRKGRQIEREVI